jgi:hypothetical protein
MELKLCAATGLSLRAGPKPDGKRKSMGPRASTGSWRATALCLCLAAGCVNQWTVVRRPLPSAAAADLTFIGIDVRPSIGSGFTGNIYFDDFAIE